MPPFAPSSIERPRPSAEFGTDIFQEFDALQATLNEWRSAESGRDEKWEQLRFVRRQLALSLAQLPKHTPHGPVMIRASEVARALAASGAQDSAIDLGDAQCLDGVRGSSWPKLAAAMVLTAAWQWAKAPLLGGVPDWLWGDYAAWLFLPPAQVLTPGESDRHAAHVSRHLEELNRWLKRNAGSAAVRDAMGSYLRVTAVMPCPQARRTARRPAELRGSLLARHFSARVAAWSNAPIPRIGRRLRVGFIHPSFGVGADLRSVFPSYVQLDARTFQTILISLSEGDRALAEASRGQSQELVVLPSVFEGRIAGLRSMDFDVLIFSADVRNRLDDITRLASQRLAPLQVLNQRSGFTSGLPEIDLYVMGNRPDAAELTGEFTERLGLLRGPAASFAIPVGGKYAESHDARKALGLPSDVPLFASVVSNVGVSRETLVTWTRVLQQSPEARLMLVRVSDELESDAAAALITLGHAFGDALQTHGVASERVAIFPVAAGAVDHVRTLLRLADVYLEPLSGADPVWTAEALVLGRPAIASSAALPISAGVELLASLEAGELIAPESESYIRIAAKLASDAGTRGDLVRRIQAAVDGGASFLDPLAAGDALGALLETAFDELAALGHAQFRSQREPLLCFAAPDVAGTVEAGEAAFAGGDLEMAAAESGLALRADPLNVAARVLRGRVLLAEGNAARSVSYLLAAVERRSDDAELWFTLAGALQQNQQRGEAIQALETSLRLDRTRVDGWLMMLEIAESVEAKDIAEEARAVLREVAPDDPRVLAMAM